VILRTMFDDFGVLPPEEIAVPRPTPAP
jgi:hypothetical protein